MVKLGLAQDTTKANSVVQAPAPTANPNTVMGATGGLNPAHGQPGHRCDIEVGAPLNSGTPAQATQQMTTTTAPTAVVTNTATAQPTTTTAKGMNPPHGQKGHRCDIAVGAPLNSVAATPKATTQSESGTVSQQMAVPLPPPNSEPTAPGMNPPHGQEGHRCDIAVGAALPKS